MSPTVPDPNTIDRLLQAAIASREHSYAPHSHFRVGAALLLADGSIVGGCNVENASYSLTICAERVAAATALAQGHRGWQAVAIASTGGVMPCGACRQFLSEFGVDVMIYTVDVDNDRRQTRTLSQLLPDAFTPTDIVGE